MDTDADLVAGVLEHAYRDEWSAVVATLARRLGDLQAAEDAAAEAFAAAAKVWAREQPTRAMGQVTSWLSSRAAACLIGPCASSGWSYSSCQFHQS